MTDDINFNLEVYELAKLLESCGCKLVYQGNADEGFQHLMLDGNSGVVFSVEMIPNREHPEIRTNSNQQFTFPTKDIVKGITHGFPLFSRYSVDHYQNLPLISVWELENTLDIQPMHARVEKLPYASEDAARVYYTTGIAPGVDDEVLRKTEQEYQADVFRFNYLSNIVIDKKMNCFPPSILDFYSYSGKNNSDIYSVMQKKK